MFVDKKKALGVMNVPNDTTNNVNTEQLQKEISPMSEMFRAVKEILSELRVDEDNPDSPPLFHTIKHNNGQVNRIKYDRWNKEYAIGFPAVFIHYTNVRFLVQQSRIGEGRAMMRIHFVLNRLNNSDSEFELEGYEVFRRINTALQKNKGKYPALSARFQLAYFDQLESFDDGLQPYWIDYEVWFKDVSTYAYKDYVDVYAVVPPFTNRSDQSEEVNPSKLPDHEVTDSDPSAEIFVP